MPLVLNLGRKDRLCGNISFPFFLFGADEVYWAKGLHAEVRLLTLGIQASGSSKAPVEHWKCSIFS